MSNKKNRKIPPKKLSSLGPGFLTGAADNDPSGVATYSLAGAKYGMLMAWLVPFQLPLMFAIQEMCARIGIVTKKGLAANMKQFFPKAIVYPTIFIFILANIVTIGANISIMAETASLLFGSTFTTWTLVIPTTIIVLQLFIPHHLYTKLLSWLALFLLAYAFTAFVTTDHWLNIIKKTFTPHITFSKDFILIATGFIGTTISPYLFFWQTSQEVESLPSHSDTMSINQIIKRVRMETLFGMFFSQLIAWFIVVTSFSTLHNSGITEITSAYEAALALRPLAGEWAFFLFALGVIGAGLIGIPVLSGSAVYALIDLYNYNLENSKIRNRSLFFVLSSAFTFSGILINLLSINTIKALLYAAVINGITTIPFIIFIIILANKVDIMGDHKNNRTSNAAGGITLGLITLSTILIITLPHMR